MPFPARLTRAASDTPFYHRVQLVASGAISENDIVIVNGRSGGLMQAIRADADAVLTARGYLWVALSAAANGAVFEGVPWRFVRNVDTSAWAAAGDPVFMSGTAGAVSAVAGVFSVQVGECMEVSATTGAYIVAPNGSYGSGGAIIGTGALTFTINDDGVAATDEDPALILEGGEGAGAELISSLLRQDSSTNRLYLWTSDTVDGTSDRTTYLTLGPLGNAQAVGDDIDSRLDFRAHVAAAAVGTFITATIVLDAGTNDLDIFVSDTAGDIDIDAGTATGAVNIDAGGGISIDAGAVASNFTLTGAADLTLSSTLGSLILASGEAAIDAVRVNASAGAGGVDIDSGTGGITIDSTGAISIDAAAASNLTVTGAFNLTITSTLGGVDISSGEASADGIHLNATNAAGGIELDAGTGGIAIDTLDGGAISIDAIGAPSNITLTATLAADDLTISVAGVFDVSLLLLSSGTGADAVRIQASAAGGGVDIDSGTAGFIVDTTGAFSIDGAAASNATVTGAFDFTVSSTLGSLVLSSGEAAVDAIRILASGAAGGGDIDVGTGGLTVDGTDGGALSIDFIGAPSNITLTATLDADDLTISVAGAFNSSLFLTSAGTGADAIRVNASAGGIDMDAAGLIAIDTSAGGISIDGAGAASNLSSTSQDLTVSTITSGTLLVSSAGILTLTSALSATWSLNGSTAGALTLTIDSINAGAGAGDVVLTADNGVRFGDAGNPTIDFAGSGAVTYTGNPTINFGTGALTLGGTSLTTTGAMVWTLLDNVATGLDIGSAGNTNLLRLVTLNGAEVVQVNPGGTGSLDVNGVMDLDVTLTAAGAGIDSDTSINHATAVAYAGDYSLIQLTTARTAGRPAAVIGRCTSLAGDLNSVIYADFECGAPTDGGGTVIHTGIYIAAGHDAALDVSAAATGESDIVVGDNLASALEIREATNAIFRVVTTNSNERIDAFYQMRTTDGVASGTARILGGLAYNITDTSASITSTAGADAETAFSNGTYTIPANTIRAGSVMHIRAMVRVSDGATAETLRCRVRLNGVAGTLLANTDDVDVATGALAIFDLYLNGHAVPGAAAEVAWNGFCTNFAANDGAPAIRLSSGIANFATNGALDLVVTAQWTGANAGDDVELEHLSVEALG